MDTDSAPHQFIDQFMPVGGASTHHVQLPFAAHLNGGMASAASYPVHPQPAPFLASAQRAFGAHTEAQRPVAIVHSAFQPYAGRDSQRADDSRGFEEGFEGSSSADVDSMDEDRGASVDPARAATISAPAPPPCVAAVAAPGRHALDLEVGADTAAIYATMRAVQHKHRPAYLPESPYVKYRRYLVDWIAETSEDLRLDCATVHVAAFYLDRVLLKAHDGATGRCLVPKHLWQLVAMVCLRLAGKFEEREEDVTGDGSATLVLADGRRVSAVEAFTRHLGDAAMAVTSAQIREWEVFVLEQLGWHLSSVTPVHCLTYFEGRGVVFEGDSWNGRPLIEKIPRYVKKYNDFFANLCLQDYFYAQFSPTLLAAAIVYAARHALSLAPLWRPELELLTGHGAGEVREVFAHIWKFYSDTFPSHARRTTTSPKGVGEFDDVATP